MSLTSALAFSGQVSCSCIKKHRHDLSSSLTAWYIHDGGVVSTHRTERRNLVQNFNVVFFLERKRGVAAEKLIHEHPERPVVSHNIVP